MAKFREIYTDQQRDACAQAKVDRGLTGPQVSELAASGHLTLAGEKLDKFTISSEYVQELARNLIAQRRGKLVSDLASLPPRDAIEALRRRLINVADAELAAVEKTKPGTRDLARFRHVISCVKEAAALPGPKDPRPPGPGQRNTEGQRPSGERSRSGPAGALMAEHLRSNGSPETGAS